MSETRLDLMTGRLSERLTDVLSKLWATEYDRERFHNTAAPVVVGYGQVIQAILPVIEASLAALPVSAIPAAQTDAEERIAKLTEQVAGMQRAVTQMARENRSLEKRLNQMPPVLEQPAAQTAVVERLRALAIEGEAKHPLEMGPTWRLDYIRGVTRALREAADLLSRPPLPEPQAETGPGPFTREEVELVANHCARYYTDPLMDKSVPMLRAYAATLPPLAPDAPAAEDVKCCYCGSTDIHAHEANCIIVRFIPGGAPGEEK